LIQAKQAPAKIIAVSIIAGSPPISLSLIVRESKWDAKASGTSRLFFRSSREAYVIVAPPATRALSRSCDLLFSFTNDFDGQFSVSFLFFFGSGGPEDRRRVRALL